MVEFQKRRTAQLLLEEYQIEFKDDPEALQDLANMLEAELFRKKQEWVQKLVFHHPTEDIIEIKKELDKRGIAYNPDSFTDEAS